MTQQRDFEQLQKVKFQQFYEDEQRQNTQLNATVTQLHLDVNSCNSDLDICSNKLFTCQHPGVS